MKQLMERLKAAYELECSPVAYIAALADQFAAGTIDKAEFAAQYMMKTREAQFFFSHMPAAQIKDNRRIFAKELVFADRITALAKNARRLTEADFQAEMRMCVEDYLASRA